MKIFCSFVYAANSGKERRELWKDLHIFKQLINNEAWVLMGDVNVSLNLNDHSEGGSFVSQDMLDFQECVNDIEVEDIWLCAILLSCLNSIMLMLFFCLMEFQIIVLPSSIVLKS